ncbi:iron ABC transporter permease [Nocardia sp. NBC_00508]|uniref:FecCD family ABC transporter permease n=1 Tax=Nocardia sp. NBC_00508 TaxID=2975992 RepID=UPI002E80C581|nr:iron ABC transporter permease [Nocardia sp. NBC_00508]WUD67187.1 iron ABC transporter permease [Nocardia sp. NBC_00508]
MTLTDTTRAAPVRRRIPVLFIGVAALLLCVVLSLALGARSVPLATVVDALLGGGAGRDAMVITGMRLPRTIVGLAVGAALGLAGAVVQGITRNPLAAPTTLGINAGAALAVVVAIFALGLNQPVQYVWFAFAGAAGAAAFTLTLGRRAGDLDPVRLVLGGTVLQLVLVSWTSAVLVFSERTLDEARFWLAGSIAQRDVDVLVPMLPSLVIGALVGLVIAPALNTLALGDEAAQALGMPVARIRLAGMVAVVLLAGSAVAVAGPIAFIGLAAPHLVRLVVGNDHRVLVPGCLIAGPLLLLAADILGRVIARPSEVEVGILTAFLGAPLLAVLARHRVER